MREKSRYARRFQLALPIAALCAAFGHAPLASWLGLDPLPTAIALGVTFGLLAYQWAYEDWWV